MGRSVESGSVLVFGLGLAGHRARQRRGRPDRTFDAPLDRVWTVTESVLKSLGWDIDTFDRAVGWILTDSRGLEFKEYAVYGKGVRHKLRLFLKAAGEGRTTVSVDRELPQRSGSSGWPSGNPWPRRSRRWRRGPGRDREGSLRAPRAPGPSRLFCTASCRK